MGYREYGGNPFEMYAVTSGGRIVGSISLYGRDCGMASLGPEIFSSDRRNGYAAEAMKLLAERAAGMGYRILMDQVRSDNAASIALHEKLGFGTDGAVYRNSRGRDVIIYVMAL